MKMIPKLSYLLFAIFCSVLLSLSFTTTAYAADSAANPQALEDLLDTAMHSRLTSYSVAYSGSTGTLQADISTAINNIYDSDDYLRYSTKGFQYSYSGSGGVVNINFTFTYWETKTQADAVSAKAAEVIAENITSDMTDFEKQKIIHDWIVKTVGYDSSLVQHSAYAGIVTPYKTVCQGYALLSYRFLNEAGIETKIVEGTAGSQAHAWNLVNLDGNWYHFDATWDDPVPDVADRVKYDYYNLTDDQIKVNHSWTKTYPTAATLFSDVLNDKITSDAPNATVYEGLIEALDLQYLESDYTAADKTQLATKIHAAVEAEETSVTIRYASKSTLAADLKAATTGLGYITSYSYGYSDYMRTTATTDVLVSINFTTSIPINVDSISLDKSTLTLTVGTTTGTGTLTPTILPSNASNKTIIWTSSDTDVATVVGGVVKAIGGGTATITATTLDGDKTATATITSIAPVKGITLDRKTLSLKVGDTDVDLVATITPESATNKSITWTSSNSSIATVSSTGKVHAVAFGTAIITATTVDGSKVASCSVLVPTPVTGVSLTPSSTTLKMGSTLALKPVLTPLTPTIKTVTWSSSDTDVATVSSLGVVTPVAEGTATITVTTTDGDFEDTCEVTVVYGVTGVTLDQTSFTLKIGDEDVTLTPTIAPSNATNKNVTWSSSNTAVATVDSDGVVHAVAPGKADIIAKSAQDSTKLAKCTVIVPVPVTGITLSPTTMALKMGQTPVALKPVIAPLTATIKTVTWSSSDTDVATVSSAGVVTPVDEGTATITVTTTDGSFTATCAITVIYAVTGVTLDKTTMTLKVGDDDVALTPTIAPSNATNKNVTWTSSSTSVATVNSDGEVHAVAPGSAIITVASAQNNKIIAKCTVTVPVVVTGVTLTPTTMTLKMGQTAVVLKPVIAPLTATIKTVTWSSSDTDVATVSSAGLVTPVGEGTATLTVTTTDGSFTATCDVTVIYAVTGVTLDRTTLTLKVDAEDVTLNPTIAPTNATNKNVTWTSSNTAVATVDADGVVHSVAPGSAIITAASAQDSKIIAKCTVLVPVSVTGVTLAPATLTMKMGQLPVILKPAVAPLTATVKTVSWTSSDTDVATVSSAGAVTPVGEGTATITVTTTDGSFTATCALTVIYAVTGITLDRTTLTLKVDAEDVTLTPTIAPTNATNKNVTWTSSNTAVATVDADGVVHSVAPGSAIITAASVQNSKIIAKCTVLVPVSVTGVTLTPTTLTMKMGQLPVTLKPAVAPLTATVKTVTWTSSDTDVATVSSAGAVTPVGEGTATITVTTTDGSFTATCALTVIYAVTGVTLDRTTLTLKVDDEDVTLTPTIAPSNATNKNVTWTSSNTAVATVDSDGVVHAVAPGKADIIAKSAQDSTKLAKCTVTVPVPVTGVTLKSTLAMKVGSLDVKLAPVIEPLNATNKAVTWSSSDTEVATVSSTGYVKAIAAGTATITVTTTDGSFTATCTVTITE